MAQLAFSEIKQQETKDSLALINVMRYMGNKQKLLNFIIPYIIQETREGDTVFDLFSGTHSVGYALKERNRILGNDVLLSSYIIGKAIIENNLFLISSIKAKTDLYHIYQENIQERYYSFFAERYSDTYFSAAQCIDIDSIRYAIKKASLNEYHKALYLTALIYAMCYAQSTPGHFAQYMPSSHPRIKELQKISIWEVFLRKCDDLNVNFSGFENKVFNSDYRCFFENEEYRELLSEVAIFYIDPPYTGEQYSRFYHLLETVIKYDNPLLFHKGLYREDRFKSKFCYLKTVTEEFDYLLKNISGFKFPKAVISYANTGLIPYQEVLKICEKYFRNVFCKKYLYPHSTQGKGINAVTEFLFICGN